MAKEVPEYGPLEGFDDLAQKLVEKYSEKFAGIDLAVVAARAITNKERPETSTKLFEVMVVKPPIREDCKYAYYVIIHQSDWDALEQKHKLLLIAQALHAIPLDDNGEMIEGKVNQPDMRDYAQMLRTFGTDYLVKENVPNLLDEQVEWVE